MSDNQQTITKWQWFTFLSVNLINIYIILIPRLVSGIAEQDAWITYLLAGVLSILVALGYLWLSLRFPTLNLYEYTRVIYGNWIGVLLNIVIFVYIFLFIGFSTRFFAGGIKLLFLDKTPITVIVASLLLVAIYFIKEGIITMAKVQDILFIIIFTGITLTILLPQKNANWNNLLPILPEGFGRVIKPISLALMNYLTFGMIGFLAPASKDKKVLVPVLGAVLLSIAVSTTLSITLLTYFGPQELNHIIYPVLAMSKGILFPGTLFERIEVIYLTAWIPIGFSGIASYMYTAKEGLINTFPTIKKNMIYLVTLVISITIALIPGNIHENFKLFTFLGIAPIFLAGIYLPVSILIVLIRGVKGS